MIEEFLDVDKLNLYTLLGQHSFEINSVVPVTTPSDLLRITFSILQMMIRRNEVKIGSRLNHRIPFSSG